ncbi:MAG: tetratricopeptide repeat protein [Sphingomonadales bacterium]|nr:tetratricopeptide repeat protein [Sphingomonadales bacterium]MDE2570548.1 tetratricopeptide repeat protein [Sphingomonadales bacterium]
MRTGDGASGSSASAGRAAAQGQPVYFLQHVPKTAGQTIRMHLRAHCPPGSFVEPTGRRDLPRGAEAIGRVQALCSHWLAQSMEQRFEGREIRRAVLLRDPVEQLVSLYNFRMSTYLDKGVGTYSFALHLRALPRNFSANFLLTRWLGHDSLSAALMPESRQFELVDAALRDFWFVGRHDDCDRLIAMVAPDLGIPGQAKAGNVMASHREFNAFPMLRASELDDGLLAYIRSRSPVDQALWEKWCLRREPAFAPAPRPVSARLGDFASFALASATRIGIRDFGRPGRIGQTRRMRLAVIAREKGQWAEAARHFRRAIGRKQGTPQLWIDLATALVNLDRYGEAVEAFDRALAIKPGMPSVIAWREQAARDAAAGQAAANYRS